MESDHGTDNPEAQRRDWVELRNPERHWYRLVVQYLPAAASEAVRWAEGVVWRRSDEQDWAAFVAWHPGVTGAAQHIEASTRFPTCAAGQAWCEAQLRAGPPDGDHDSSTHLGLP